MGHSIVCATFNIFKTEQQYSTIASGRVLDDDGNPVSGATVTAQYNGAVAATATSDANGIYALVLPPSDTVRNYAVDATCENYRSMGGITVSAPKMTVNLSNQEGLTIFLR